jgi:hypothetical protein
LLPKDLREGVNSRPFLSEKQELVKKFTKFLPHFQTHCFISAASLEVRPRIVPQRGGF